MALSEKLDTIEPSQRVCAEGCEHFHTVLDTEDRSLLQARLLRSLEVGIILLSKLITGAESSDKRDRAESLFHKTASRVIDVQDLDLQLGV